VVGEREKMGGIEGLMGWKDMDRERKGAGGVTRAFCIRNDR
jgi:hypothetical protein